MAEPTWLPFRKRALTQMRPYRPGEKLERVSISPADKGAGSPKDGDMIARDPNNPGDMWLVSEAYFDSNYEGAGS